MGKKKRTSATSILVRPEKKSKHKDDTGGDLCAADRRKFHRIQQKQQAAKEVNTMAADLKKREKRGSKKYGLITRVVKDHLGADRVAELKKEELARVKESVRNVSRGLVASKGDDDVVMSNSDDEADAEGVPIIATIFTDVELTAMFDQLDYFESLGYQTTPKEQDEVVKSMVVKKYGSLDADVLKRFKTNLPGFPGPKFWLNATARTGRTLMTPEDRSIARIGAATTGTLGQWSTQFQK